MVSSIPLNFPKLSPQAISPPPSATISIIMLTLPNLDERHLYWDCRAIQDEDDNISTTKEIKRQNRRDKILHRVKRSLTFNATGQPLNLAAPEPRPFRWMISSYHLPPEYQAESVRSHSPWFLVLRCLLIDLPDQLENGIGTTTSWRDHQVP